MLSSFGCIIMLSVVLWLFVWLLMASLTWGKADTSTPVLVDEVYVYHFIVPHWGNSFAGWQQCPNLPKLRCHWTYGDHLSRLRKQLKREMREVRARRKEDRKEGGKEAGSDGGEEWNWSIYKDPHHNKNATETWLQNAPVEEEQKESAQHYKVNGTYTMSLYNVHSLWERKREHHPAICELRTSVTMVESEESKVRYGHLFGPSFKNFDGYSTTSPSSHLQRVYHEVFLNETDFIENKPFAKMVKGASYVASDCHKRDAANANRDNVVLSIRDQDFRVDGLGRCLRSPIGPEGYELPKTRDTRYNLQIKRDVISNYMFNMAFENSLEPGYVTEKPFDALISGTVPIYLGDAKHLKMILPHPKAAIFLDDFGGDVVKLAAYLKMLTNNETAYEEHRAWRVKGQYTLSGFLRRNADVPLLGNSWACRVCQWTRDAAQLHHKRRRNCAKERSDDDENKTDGHDAFEKVDATYYNGRAVRGGGREVYLVEDARLRLIPSLDTFFALNLSLADVIQIGDREFQQIPKGENMPYLEWSGEGK